jgi:hypothetical protein
MDAFRTIAPPTGISGKAFCTVKRTPFTFVLKVFVELLLCDLTQWRERSSASVHEEHIKAALLLLYLAI